MKTESQKWWTCLRVLKTKRGFILTILTIAVAAVCLPLLVVGLEYYKTSNMVVKTLQDRMTQLQSAAMKWNETRKAAFMNLEVDGYITDSWSTVFEFPFKLTATNKPADIDLFVQSRSKVYYDIHRYVAEIDYPSNGTILNITGIRVNGQAVSTSGNPLVKVFNFTKLDITMNDFNPLNSESILELANSTVVNICKYRYRGEWINSDDICMVTTYSSLCFISDFPEINTQGFGCYYNTINQFQFDQGYLQFM